MKIFLTETNVLVHISLYLCSHLDLIVNFEIFDEDVIQSSDATEDNGSINNNYNKDTMLRSLYTKTSV